MRCTLMFEIGFHILHGETISDPNAKVMVKPIWARLGAARLHIIPARNDENVKYLTKLVTVILAGYLNYVSSQYVFPTV